MILAIIIILIALMPIKVYYSILISEPQMFLIVKLYNLISILDDTISLEDNKVHFKGSYNRDFTIKELLTKPKWIYLLKALNLPIVNVYTFIGGQFDYSTALIGVWNTVLSTISGVVQQKGVEVNYKNSLSPDTESYICVEGIISSSISQIILVVFNHIVVTLWNALMPIKIS